MNAPRVERWGMYELELTGPSEGNPFVEVSLTAQFRYRNRAVDVTGFYDGDGRYLIRFMPDTEGEWRYRTSSTAAALSGIEGSVRCVPAGPGNHGPVGVDGDFHFRYADGARHISLGTTCYHWTHHGDDKRERETLESLRESPFNKVRMCLLPTSGMQPESIAFAGSEPENVDLTRFNPHFFAHFEGRIRDLQELGIEADLILFHPYDKGYWGFDSMDLDEDIFYLRYVIARLAAFRNVWWSMSNEYDFNRDKSVAQWDRLLQFVQRTDPYQRLSSIHNGTKMYEIFSPYDFTKSWITHQSVQHWDGEHVPEWRATCRKPIVIDEIGYEGNGPRRWGNLTGQELTHRFWQVAVNGGYPGHGECYVGDESSAWVSSGGRLIGDSPARIGFLGKVLAEAPVDIPAATAERSYFLSYIGHRQPARINLDLDPNTDYTVDLIDTWAMSIERLPGRYRGLTTVDLPGRPYLAVRAERS